MPISIVAGTPVGDKIGGTGATIVKTLGAAVAVNDTLIVGLNCEWGGGDTPTGVTDQLGNTYTQRFSFTESVNTFQEFRVFTARVSVAGTPVITGTYSSVNATGRIIHASAWRGVASGNPVGQSATGTGTTGPTMSTGTLTPSEDNMLVWAQGHWGIGTFTQGAGFTFLSTAPDTFYTRAEYQLQTTRSAGAVTFTNDGTPGSWAVIGLSLKAASNEPTGFTLATERAFDATSENSWGAFGGSPFSIITDATAPKSPSNVGQIEFLTNFAGGTQPAFTQFADLAPFGFTRVYLSFWHQLSSNWQGHPTSAVNKIVILWMHGHPIVTFSAQGAGSNPLEPQIRLQDVPGGNPNSGNLTPNLGGATVSRGAWHRWEAVLVVNTGANLDGEAHLWLDGIKVAQYTNVIYASAEQSHIWGSGGYVEWRPIWGGTNELVAATMYQWMDHLAVSGQAASLLRQITSLQIDYV